ncbi:MAG: hypothetical protein QM487_15320 [Candidatus Marithrix sp.]
MAKVNLSTIKNWFKTGLKPTQAQFWDTWDSFRHKDEQIPVEQISDIAELLAEKADAEALANHLIDAAAHSELFDAKVDKVEGQALSDNNLTNELLAKINAANSLSGSRILRGGFAILPNRIIRLFIYEYLIADKYYDTPVLADVQLDVGGADDRADTVAINNLSQAVVKKGIEGDPSPPDVDIATELFITWRLMKAGATEPEGSTATVMYDENLGEAGGEWDASTNNVTINLDGNSNPSSGAKSITITDNNNYDVFHLLKSAPVAIDSDGALQLTVNLQTEWIENERIWVLLYNGGTRIHTNFIALKDGMYGLDGALLNTQQEIAIPFKDYNLTSDSYNMVQFFFVAEGKTLSIDNIRTFNNTNQPDTGGETSQVISRTSQIPINDGEDGTSKYTEDKNLGAVAFSNSYNDLIDLPVLSPFPSAYLTQLVPDTQLPNTVIEIIMTGSYFTKSMENGGVLVQGQTVNDIQFINDNEIRVRLTSGASEGFFDVTLNNGSESVFPNAFSITSGDVFIPTSANFTIVNNNADVTEDGAIKVTDYGVLNYINTDIIIDYTKPFYIRWKYKESPLGFTADHNYTDPDIRLTASGSHKLSLLLDIYATSNVIRFGAIINGVYVNKTPILPYSTSYLNFKHYENSIWEIRHINGAVGIYIDGALIKSTTVTLTENLIVSFRVKYRDIVDFKIITFNV